MKSKDDKSEDGSDQERKYYYSNQLHLNFSKAIQLKNQQEKIEIKKVTLMFFKLK